MLGQGRKQSAFTLLEMLVVLMLVSLISTLLMQALAYIGKVNLSFHQHASSSRKELLVFGWFRDAVENLVAPERGHAAMRFRGDEFSFEAVSMATLERRLGVPRPFAFRLERRDGQPGAQLIYVRILEDSRWPLLQLQGQARFRYLDERGAWHGSWPPSPSAEYQLPEALALEALEDEFFVLSAVLAPKSRAVADDH
jgi:general secretion pathway protein J